MTSSQFINNRTTLLLIPALVVLIMLSCAPETSTNNASESIEESNVDTKKVVEDKEVSNISASETIDHRDVDILLLEQLVHDEINKVKRANGQVLLKRHKILQNAAVDQNNYQVKLGDITHEQNNNQKATLGKRVKAYGGGFRAMAENVLYEGFIIRTIGNRVEIIAPSYREHAKKMVKSWMDSPGHRANILNSSYDRVGTAIGYNGDLHAVFATQVFGKEF